MTPKQIAKKLSSKYFGHIMGFHNSVMFENDVREVLEDYIYKSKQSNELIDLARGWCEWSENYIEDGYDTIETDISMKDLNKLTTAFLILAKREKNGK
jgi:hypothetical protein